ncbi:NAD(P)/FAD-dependent oxidoreductase [soil metagenome]
MTDAVVVGSGPNGLSAAIALAQAGIHVTVIEAADTVGGGMRSSELTLPGLIHDDCSAFHPMGVASPFLSSLGLDEFGLTWAWPEVQIGHPLDGGRAGILHRSVDETAAGLGIDGEIWRKLFGPLTEDFDDIVQDFLGPVVHLPKHPVTMAKFGLKALQPARLLGHRFATDEARGLFGGVCAHSFYELGKPTSSAAGLMLAAAGHRYGWPVAVGGSQAIADALAGKLRSLGGVIETGREVTTLSELSADVVMLDVSPSAVVSMAGDKLAPRIRRAYEKWKYGPSAFKVDFAVEGGIPWTNEDCRRAGTLHVGGTYGEIAAAEKESYRGTMPERPFVLVGQQYLADPSRSQGDTHPVWTYAHVPHGYDGDVVEPLIAQIERFAPGFRERIVGQFVRDPAAMASYNANYVGGDISTGANNAWQIVARPRLGVDPYATGIPGTYICSAASPPGGGVHGMAGFHASRSALRHLAG